MSDDDTADVAYTATQARDEAITRVQWNADPEWFRHALIVVYSLAMAKQTFTTDDVWAALGSEITIAEPRAMGAVMRMAARDGICITTRHYTNSTRRMCHARPLRVWQSLVAK